MTGSESRRSPQLNPDAASFLAEFGTAYAFPEPGADFDERAAAFLAGERLRLSAIPGVEKLNARARSVRAEDHDLGHGLSVRVYVPPGDGVRPAVIYLHGGGFVSGSVNLSDSSCRIMAAAGDFVVVSVEYRLAPEWPYPAALDDTDRTLAWVRDELSMREHVDRDRIAVCGASAGGALAAALAIRLRDRGDRSLALQALIYPVLDASMSHPSYDVAENGSGFFVTAPQMAWYWAGYRGDAGLDSDPEFSPAAVARVDELPPSIVLTAGFDPLRDEGFDFVRRLREAGVPCEHVNHADQIHGFMALLEAIGDAVPALSRTARSIRAALDGTA